MTVWVFCDSCEHLGTLEEFLGDEALECPECEMDESGIQILTQKEVNWNALSEVSGK